MAAAAAGVLLLVGWAIVTIRHATRRQPSAAEWEGGQERPDLWTSGARCLQCSASGGLLRMRDQQLEFECLSCGATYLRQERG